ncbi:MAG: lipopolysaccharide biosynthesis protein, partial [Prevotella sp.]
LKNPRHEDYNSVFWFNIIVACSLYIVLFFCAPLIADFYHTERLVPLCRYAFLSIILAGLGTSQSAYMFKNLMASRQAKAGMTAVLLSSITGAVMAWQGMAYWSLATQGLVYVFLNTALLWIMSPWRPTLHIDFRPVRNMFRFSCKILATTIITHINTNVLNVLLGRFFTKTDAGQYYQAYQWDSKCFYLVQGMVQQVAQPVLAGLNGEDGRQLNVLRKMMRFTSFISFPLLFGLSMVSEEFILITIKAKWLFSAQLLSVLCIAGAVMPLCTLLSNTVISKGRSDVYMWCTVILGVLQIALMIILRHHGISLMVMAYTAVNIIWLFVWHHFAGKFTAYSLTMFLCDIVPFALAAAGVMVATAVLTSWIETLWLLLVARIILAAALYFAVMKTARVRILDECMAFVMAKLKKK